MALQNLRSGVANKRPIPTIMSEGQIALNTNEASPGLFFKDSNGDLVKVGPVHIGTSAPNSSPASTAATALVTGATYQILTVGTSDFTLVGASANTVGTIFTATGTTTGTGTVSGQQGVEKGEQWLDTTGGNYVLKIYDGTAWRSEAGEFVNVSGDTMTGALLLDNAASVSAPDLSFDGDANTGIYSPGADQFGVATGGTAALTIDASQQVGIGTTSPSDKLEITPGSNREGITIKHTGTTFGGISIDSNRDSASQTLGDFRFMWNGTAVAGISGSTGSDTTNKDDGDLFFNTSSSGANTERMRIDSSGNVGIGTSSPTQKLEIKHSSNTDAFTGLKITSNNQLAYVHYGWRGLDGSDQLRFSTGTNERMRIDSSGNVGIGTTSPQNPLHIYDAVDNGVLRLESGDEYVHVEFKDSTTTSVPYIGAQGNNVRVITGGAERFRIDSSGNVGIGRTPFTSPAGYPLQLRGGSQVFLQMSTSGHGDTATDGLSIGADGSSAYITQRENAPIAISTNNIERMRIDSSGNVGIGTTSPSVPLEVSSSSFDSFKVVRNGAGAGAKIGLVNGDGNEFQIIHDGGEALVFRYGNSTEHMRIDSSGNLLLKQESASSPYPEQKLKWSNDSTTTNGFYISQDTSRNGRVWHEQGLEILFGTNNTERMRIDSSGRLLVGTTSARTDFASGIGTAPSLQVEGTSASTGAFGLIRNANSNSAAAYLQLAKTRGTTNGSNTIVQNGDRLGYISFSGANGTDLDEAAGIEAFVDGTPGADDMPGRLVFSTTADGASSPTERMRIKNYGQIYTYVDSPNAFAVGTSASTSATNACIYLQAGATGIDTGTITFRVQCNGDVDNTNNSYGAISDVKLKENIVDANSQWSDIKSIQVRNYNYKEETGFATHTQIGVIAQEIESVSPGLVTDTPDVGNDGNDLDTTTKSVNYSVLYMKAVKALQEAMDRIETLEAKVAALEAS